MKAARFYEAGESLQVEDVPRPEPALGEVLVAVRAAGVCGTDVHIALEGTIPTAHTPITLGHEGAGVIAALGTPLPPPASGGGEGVTGWQAGDRVCFLPHVPCGECWYCTQGRETLCPRTQIFGLHRDGTFAEAIVVPARCLVALPKGIPFELGAVLTDAVSTAYHAVAVRGAVQRGECVVVIGCGGVGHHVLLFARRLGAGQVIAVDVAEGVLHRAREAGADATVNAAEEDVAKQVKGLTDSLGADLAVECVGRAETVTTALKCLRRGGRAVVVGVGPERVTLPPLQAFVGLDLALLGSMGFDRADLETVIGMVGRGELDLTGSVSETVPLAEINQAMQRVAEAAPGIAAGAIYAFTKAWDEFLFALTFVSTAPELKPYTLALYRFIADEGTVSWHQIAAAAFISVVPVLIMFTLFQKYFIAGLTGGALKG